MNPRAAVGLILTITGPSLLFSYFFLDLSVSNEPKNPVYQFLHSRLAGISIFLVFAIIAVAITIVGLQAFTSGMSKGQLQLDKHLTYSSLENIISAAPLPTFMPPLRSESFTVEVQAPAPTTLTSSVDVTSPMTGQLLTVSGNVLDQLGRPLPDVSVFLYVNDSRHSAAKSGSDGSYRFQVSLDSPGTYKLFVSTDS